MPRAAIALVMVISAAGCRSEAKAKASAGADANANANANANAKVRAAVASAGVPGIGYAVVTRERDVVVAGSGVADLLRQSRAGAETVFEAASIAKLLVAICVMQLVEEKKVDLDAEASKYVGFAIRHPRGSTPITLRMLLAHRASIRHPEEEIPAPRTPANALGAFLERTMLDSGRPREASYLDAEPGTATTYSNVGASLAALAVERVAHESFADISTRRVLAPLRMHDTTWVAPAPLWPRTPRGRTRVVTPASSRSPHLLTRSIRPSISIRRRATSPASLAPCCATASSTEHVS
jgi:CubicO group peptidase (beta-lactamase class C family)